MANGKYLTIENESRRDIDKELRISDSDIFPVSDSNTDLFPFLKLPVELRLRIYKELLKIDANYIICELAYDEKWKNRGNLERCRCGL